MLLAGWGLGGHNLLCALHKPEFPPPREDVYEEQETLNPIRREKNNKTVLLDKNPVSHFLTSHSCRGTPPKLLGWASLAGHRSETQHVCWQEELYGVGAC